MWPFGERLKDRDAVEKYRRWLRRWLLGSWRCIAACTVAAALMAGIIWAAVNTRDDNSQPAAGDKPAAETITGSPPAAPSFSIDRLEDKQVKQQEQGINDNKAAGDSQAAGKGIDSAETVVSSVLGNDAAPSLALPVSGKKISSYGYHYSPLYEDYRFHTGIVLQSEETSDVHPCMPGKVIEISGSGELGYTVTMDHGDGWAGIYEGLARVTVEEGDNLTPAGCLGQAKTAAGDGRGEIIFTLTRNGKAVDPTPYLQKY